MKKIILGTLAALLLFTGIAGTVSTDATTLNPTTMLTSVSTNSSGYITSKNYKMIDQYGRVVGTMTNYYLVDYSGLPGNENGQIYQTNMVYNSDAQGAKAGYFVSGFTGTRFVTYKYSFDANKNLNVRQFVGCDKVGKIIYTGTTPATTKQMRNDQVMEQVKAEYDYDTQMGTFKVDAAGNWTYSKY